MALREQGKLMGRLIGLAFALALGGARIFSEYQATAEPAKTHLDQQSPLTTSSITSETLLSNLVYHDQLRARLLQQYSVDRTYLVKTDGGNLRSEAHVLLNYKAPDTKEFKVISEEGPSVFRSVLNTLLKLEAEATSERSNLSSSITPANYTFILRGREKIDGLTCFVVEAVPKRKDRCLFEGKVWIEAGEFAIVKIVGEPAKTPSFWIKKATFVRQYQRIGVCWLPLKDETTAQIRVFGNNTLTIYHNNYRVRMSEDRTFNPTTASDFIKRLSIKDVAMN